MYIIKNVYILRYMYNYKGCLMSEKKIIGVFKVQHRKMKGGMNHFVTIPKEFYDVDELVFEQDNNGIVTVRSNGDD